MADPKEWYAIEDIDRVDSPSLVVYWERVIENIARMEVMIGDLSRLRPHVKTHKNKEVALQLLLTGVTKFKCATIAEAEMLAMVGAPDVLLAYQPVGPKLDRFLALVKKYETTRFSCLVDHEDTARSIASGAANAGLNLPVFIDLNTGMNRTGMVPGPGAIELYELCNRLSGIQAVGLHVYDGHIRHTDLEERTRVCNASFAPVEAMRQVLVDRGYTRLIVVAGGTPTFPVHSQREGVECSPGTFVYWDYGYEQQYPEQKFVPAALVISRIISLPDATKICLDLGHKSVASENLPENRVVFLNAPEGKVFCHNEEHLVLEVPEGHSYRIGDVFYGVPVHICPTSALYEKATVIREGRSTDEWRIVARDRKLTE